MVGNYLISGTVALVVKYFLPVPLGPVHTRRYLVFPSFPGNVLSRCLRKILFTKYIIWRQNRSSYLSKVLPSVALPVILNVLDTCINLNCKVSLLLWPQTLSLLAHNPGGKHRIQCASFLSRHVRPFQNLFLLHDDGEDYRWPGDRFMTTDRRNLLSRTKP